MTDETDAEAGQSGRAPDAAATYLDVSEEWSPRRSESRSAPTGGGVAWEKPAAPTPPTAATAAGPASTAWPSSPATSPERGGRGRVTGVARAVQLRYDQSASEDVLSFRVEQYDAGGNRLPPVPVELRGNRLSGQLTEGEEVEVAGEWRHGTLLAYSVANRTTQADVRARSWHTMSDGAKRVTLGVLGFLALAVVAVIVLVLVKTVGGDDPAPRDESGSRAEPVTVPNLVGQDEFFASPQLSRFELTSSRVVESSDSVPRGKVIRTEPAAGSPVERGSNVVLYVSGGAKVTVPNVAGQEIGPARVQLERAGLQVSIVPQSDPRVGINRVIRTEPAAGASANAGDEVHVYLSTGR